MKLKTQLRSVLHNCSMMLSVFLIILREPFLSNLRQEFYDQIGFAIFYNRHKTVLLNIFIHSQDEKEVELQPFGSKLNISVQVWLKFGLKIFYCNKN